MSACSKAFILPFVFIHMEFCVDAAQVNAAFIGSAWMRMHRISALCQNMLRPQHKSVTSVRQLKSVTAVMMLQVQRCTSARIMVHTVQLT